MPSGQVVITGLGAVSCLGLNVDELWQGLIEGKCGIDTIKAFDPAGFPCKIAGQAGDFKVRDHVPKKIRKSTKLMCRDIELSVLASNEAFADSGIVTKATDPENVTVASDRMAINFGSNVICCELEEIAPCIAKSIKDGKFDLQKWGAEGLNLLTPLWLLKYLPNMLACHVGIIHEICGPSNSLTCGEAGGQLAISEAMQIIKRGDAEVALAGGCESKVNPIMILRQIINKRCNTESNDAPDKACRPFSADANGSVFGEGAGMLVLEDMKFAESRGAKIQAVLAGTGESHNICTDIEKLEPEAKGIQYAIETALEEAGITPDQIDLIIPHGTGIPADDLAEAKAIERVLGNTAKTAITLPIMGMVSNTGAASGALGVVTAVKAMQESKIPAANNSHELADGCNLNIPQSVQEKEIRYALCTSYTYGGQTAAVVIKKA